MNRVLFRYELLGLLRDTRTLFLSIILPMVLLPVLLMTLNAVGPRPSSQTRDFNYGMPLKSNGIERVVEPAVAGSKLRQLLVEDGEEMLNDEHLDLYVKAGKPPTDDRPEWSDAAEEMFPSFKELIRNSHLGRPVVEIVYRSDRDRSTRAFIEMRQHLVLYRQRLVSQYFHSKGLHLGVPLKSNDLSSKQEKTARKYGPALASFFVMMLLGGGSVAALDSLAGERERGTLSTLFVSSLERSEILGAKFAAVASMSVGVALLQMLNLGFYVGMGWVLVPIEMSLATGLLVFACLSLIFAAEALFTAALLLHVSAHSRTFKEAQLFFFPIFLVAFALSLSGLLPGWEARSAMSLVPLAGPGLAIPELLAGRIDVLVLILQVGLHAGLAWLLFQSSLKLMSSESFLGGEKSLLGEELRFESFSQRTLPFYALMAAALMVVPANFEALSTLFGQGVFNQLFVFLAAPLLFCLFYKRDLRSVIPLKSVSFKIIILCLFLVPLGQLSATGFSHLLGPFLPAPVSAMEQMLKMLDVENTPLWALFLLIGVLPGICEEVAFRGVLLHALHRRYKPWMLAAVVAFVFGCFHMSFFRILPTAFLGFFLGLVTLATGSIIPAMLIHIGNNSLAVWAMSAGIDMEGLSSGVYFLAFLGQVAVTYLVIRWGKGYRGTVWRKGLEDSDQSSLNV